jgi:hypothetical protein
MFIVDFHQVMIANIMGHLNSKTMDKHKIDEELVRHMILNSIRYINNRFKKDYGKMVIAYDSKKNWRKEVFPYYKANRKKNRDESMVDWVLLFDFFKRIKEELKEVLPYRVIDVEGCEADDIIATLVRYARNNESVMIVSGDKDFIQLHGDNVSQYDPVRKRDISTSLSPADFLIEHILKGDSSDGIPNVYSDDDTFIVAGKRQTPLTRKKIDMLMNTIDDVPMEWAAVNRNFARNEQLIDLTKIPEALTIEVMEVYAHFPDRDKKALYNYLGKHQCSNLILNLGDF